MFSNMRLITKIGLGFAVLIGILALAIAITLVQVRQMNALTNQVAEVRVPTASASLTLLNGLNRSLAALRGWMLLGDSQFKDERAVAWADELDVSLKTMQALSKDWTSPANVERLRKIEQKLPLFAKIQQEIEDIANTPDNIPALKILNEQTTALTNTMGDSITKLIDLEAQEKGAADRKTMLYMMADIRGTTGLAVASLRAYLLSGDSAFKQRFEALWAKNETRLGDLQGSRAALTAEQQATLDTYSRARTEFNTLPDQLIKLRESDAWNIANQWLQTKAAPLAVELNQILREMAQDQQQLQAVDTAEVKRLSEQLVALQWVLLVAGVLLGTVLSLVIARAINITEHKHTQHLLEKAKWQAEKESQAKSEFLAKVSHEIRSPLHTIVGMSEILCNRAQSLPVDPDFKEHLDTVKSSAEILMAMVNNVLDLSRIETGKISVVMELINIRGLIQQLMRIHQLTLQQKSLVFSCTLDPGVPELILSDRMKLIHILTNILANAIRFTPEHKQISLNVQQVDDSIVFVIRDQGIGIAADKQHCIFKAFEQVDPDATQQYEGIGLGLAISQQMVLLLNGDITLESTLGEGSAFTVKIPLAQANSCQWADLATVIPCEQGEYQLDKNSRILVIGAELEESQIIKVFCDELGIEAQFVASDQQTMDILGQTPDRPFNLIILDVHMPDANFDGIHIIDHIRLFSTYQNTPIIGLFKNAFFAQQQAAFTADMSDYLIKPIHLGQLLVTVTTYLHPAISLHSPNALFPLTPITLPVALQHRLQQALDNNALTHIKATLVEIERYGKNEKAFSQYLRSLLVKYDLAKMRYALKDLVQSE